ncbi:DUF2326 domain-containing protein [Clostridium chauvoei]|uniref:DUF2326 domain-containing protein n=2 Tax=Clostridium chauvoei TaxID=46867 RepID=A0A1U6JHD9_9CLOT|nr:DUF2326 domain-containing protein [Clostridium chauvoei]ATD55431.1 hypothetical protein BTM20_09355 [Clostridium chauvoei]ATD56897.1 hypothetical protein BTM21_03685 [Clostridium chauvoei]MBX7280735.1 DUF2326 domain-containing protein [Clostridium chauvoei]MBX7283218.1 DUF2326 domain-containing protein [Clostridium chauvoei]MBX7285897.1 DUF2326 domain-containing protein [Clostridium chauvoei]
MYIKRLTANKESFHSIEFQPNNFNIILGTKSKDADKKNNTGETVNGVGKSLTVKLIDYCLGSRQTSHKIISKLKDSGWQFELNLQDENKFFNIIRDVDSGKVIFNNKDLTVTKVNNILEAEIFDRVENYKYLSFRNLICRYLRIPKLAYIKWEQYKSKEDEDKSVLYNSYLLGLDPQLIINKINNKTQINEAEKSKKYIEKDETIKKLMNGSKVSIGITNLSKEIEELEKKLSNFKISEGYNDVKLNIEKSKVKKNEIINEITKYNNTIKTIDKNLKINVDITCKKVEEIYEEAKVLFSSEMIKSLEEISIFHEQLLEGRKARLIKDKKRYIDLINKLEIDLKSIDNTINKDLSFIQDKVSTNEYERLQNRLTELKIQLEKAQQYEKLLKEFEQNIAEIKADMAQDNLKAIKYLESISEYIKELSVQFQGYVDYIYDERKYSGIDIENNDGNNKIRYDIIPQIQGDDSDGVGNVKLFCMDLLIWERQINNSIEFLYHDGFLFTDIDPRQVYRMLKLAYSICKNKNRQYIFNINYNMFENILSVAKQDNDTKFVEYLESCVILRLYDDKPEQKLLGIEI